MVSRTKCHVGHLPDFRYGSAMVRSKSFCFWLSGASRSVNGHPITSAVKMTNIVLTPTDNRPRLFGRITATPGGVPERLRGRPGHQGPPRMREPRTATETAGALLYAE